MQPSALRCQRRDAFCAAFPPSADIVRFDWHKKIRPREDDGDCGSLDWRTRSGDVGKLRAQNSLITLLFVSVH